MKGVTVVRIQWPKGIERISVTETDTVGTLIEKMESKCKFSSTNLTLYQVRTQTVVQSRVKLASLEMENGELFRLNVPIDSLAKSSNMPIPPINAASKPVFRSSAPIIEQQVTTKVKKVLLPDTEIARIGHITYELHFSTTKFFFLYGTRPSSSVVRIHSSALIDQSFKNSTLVLNEAQKKAADNVAQLLKLEFVGAAVISPKRDPPLSAAVLSALALLSASAGESFVVISVLPPKDIHDIGSEKAQCSFEAFQLSKQFMDLSKEGFLKVDPSNTSQFLAAQKVRLYTKISESVSANYFLAPVAVSKRESWFPRSRFPFQAAHPTIADFAEAINADFEVPDFVRLLDFGLLIFFEGWVNDRLLQVVRSCIGRQEMPPEIEMKIEEMVSSAAIAFADRGR